jgi:hypothetical protein
VTNEALTGSKLEKVFAASMLFTALMMVSALSSA